MKEAFEKLITTAKVLRQHVEADLRDASGLAYTEPRWLSDAMEHIQAAEAALKNPSDAGGIYIRANADAKPRQEKTTQFTKPTPPQADAPIKGAGELKPYFIARLENLRSEYAHENGTVEADTGYFLAKDEHAESYLEGIDRCIELLRDTASSQNSNFCGFPLVMDYMLPPEVIEIRAHNGEVMAHVLLDDVKEIAGNGY